MHELREICRVKGVLPKSCTLSTFSLVGVSLPSASGYVCEGTLDGSNVHIKRVRMFPRGDPQEVKEVCFRCYVSRLQVLTNLIDLPRGGRGVETLETSQRRPPSGCNCRSSPTSFGLDVRWRPDGIHHEPSRCRQAESRACAFHYVV